MSRPAEIRSETLAARARGGLFLVLTSVLILAAAPASALIASRYVIDGPDTSALAPEGVARTGMFSWPPVLLSRKMHSERAVRITEDAVVPAGWTMTGKPIEYALKAGDILTGGADQPGVYCIGVRGAGVSGICLKDADGDGKFEVSQAGLCDYGNGGYEIIIWAGPDKVCGFTFGGRGILDRKGQSRPLSTPLAYAQADPKEGPGAWANLIFRQTRKAKDGKPGRFYLEWAIGKQNEGKLETFASFSPQEYDIPAGGVGQVATNLIVIDFLGYDPDGGLRYRVTTQPPGGVIKLFRPIVRHITIVV